MDAFRIVGLMSLSLLAGCVTSQPQQRVVLSEKQSAFDTPMDGRWRKAHESRPIAVLLGRAETTRILLPRRAALEVSCYKGKPRVRVAYDVGLQSGPIAVAYRFGESVEQKGVVRVRGRRRNIVTIDYAPTAAAMLASLRASTTLRVRAQRPPFEMHDAHFKWDPNDSTLKAAAEACTSKLLHTEPRRPGAASDDDDDDDDALDGAVKDVMAAG